MKILLLKSILVWLFLNTRSWATVPAERKWGGGVVRKPSVQQVRFVFLRCTIEKAIVPHKNKSKKNINCKPAYSTLGFTKNISAWQTHNIDGRNMVVPTQRARGRLQQPLMDAMRMERTVAARENLLRISLLNKTNIAHIQCNEQINVQISFPQLHRVSSQACLQAPMIWPNEKCLKSCDCHQLCQQHRTDTCFQNRWSSSNERVVTMTRFCVGNLKSGFYAPPGDLLGVWICCVCPTMLIADVYNPIDCELLWY